MTSQPSQDRAVLLRMAALALLYAALAKAVLLFFPIDGAVFLMFWPPAGVALAALLLGGRRYWPGIFVGALAAHLLAGTPFVPAVSIACGNTLEALAGLWLMRRENAVDSAIDNPRSLLRLMLAAAIGATVAAAVGSVTLWLSGMQTSRPFLFTLLQWWQSDLLGMALVTPLILVWRRFPSQGWRAFLRGVEFPSLLLLAFLSGQLAFLGWFHDPFGAVARPYWTLLCLTWAAARFRHHGVLLVLAMTAVQALGGAMQGVGFFANDAVQTHLENFWIFMVVLTIVSLSLASMMNERERAERRLWSEKRLSDDIIDSLPGAFYMLDEQARLVRWNARLAAATGYSSAELRQMPALALVAEEDRARIAEKIGEVFAHGESGSEAMIVGKDGTKQPYRFSSRRAVLDGSACIVGVGEDITERKEIERTLHESEARYRALFDNIGVSITIFAPDTTILMLNDSSARTLGGVPGDFIGKTLYDLHFDQAGSYDRRHRDILGSGQGGIFEDAIPFPDGTRWFSTRLAPIYGIAGASACLQAVSVDITERKKAEQALQEREAYYRLLFEGTEARIVIFDTDGVITMINEKNARMLGGVPADFIGRSIYDLVPDGTGEAYRQRFTKIIRERKGGTFEDAYDLPDGRHWFSSQLEPVTDASGRIHGIQLVAVEITRRKRMEEALRESEALWKFALEGAGDAVWDWDAVADRIEYSKRWNEMLGYDPGDAADLADWLPRVHPDDLPAATASRENMLNGNAAFTDIELRMRCKDGSYKWILSRGMVVSRDAGGKPLRVVGTNADITLLKEHQRQLEHIAHFDTLTGLPNRVLLADRLRQAMAHSHRRNKPLVIAYLDLDGFKAVNDRHGHDIGDELLVLVAQRMKAVLRDGDTLARIGGDEFVAVLTDLDHGHHWEPVVDRLLQAAATPAQVGEAVLYVSASIGVTLYPRDGADADQLLRHADQAMYQAKQAGRNRHHLFDVEQDAAAQTRRETTEHIRLALIRNEFVLHYQPKVNMRTGALVGVEALIRWQHPERGLLPPAAFLPVIEDHAISIKLGEWVIDAALTQMEAWRALGLDIPVSVNVAARHLQNANFVTHLASTLAVHPGVEPSRLELEILETSALEDIAQVSGIMHACQVLGTTFALDDFGTGYSSLTYLRRLPAELLKIDQSFVRDMLDDPDDLSIVESVVGLAQAFRRKVIAEGVETVEHGALLLQLGCDHAQGYGISRPMPAGDLPAWLAQWRPHEKWASWGSRAPDREDLGLAFVEVRHRHWLRSIEAFLDGVREAPPALDPGTCDLEACQWSSGSMSGLTATSFAHAIALHRQVHLCGSELVELHLRGQQSAARDGLAALRLLHDELIAALRSLAQGGRGGC